MVKRSLSIKLPRRRWSQGLALSPAYRAWVAENLLNGARPEVVQAALEERGVPAAIAEEAVLRVGRSPELAGARRSLGALQRGELAGRLRRTLRRLGPRTIERRSLPEADEFVARYYATGTPVIFTDLVPRWPAFSGARWSPESFKARFGAVEIEMSIGRAADPDPDVRFREHCRTTTLADYVDRVLAAGETNDLYLIANNRNLGRPGLAGLLADIALPPGWFGPRAAASGALWFGPAGTVTSLHHDTSNILFCQVVGRKRFRLYPPDEPALLAEARGVYSHLDPEAPGEALADAFGFDEVLAPGEALFLPVGWWHHVRALDVSIGAAFNGFVWEQGFEWYKPGTIG